jgi:hypothetical protein
MCALRPKVEVTEQRERWNDFIRKELHIRSINRVIKERIWHGNNFILYERRKCWTALKK